MTESLQNKNKITNLSRKEAGGDEKHMFIFLLGIIGKTNFAMRPHAN